MISKEWHMTETKKTERQALHKPNQMLATWKWSCKVKRDLKNEADGIKRASAIYLVLSEANEQQLIESMTPKCAEIKQVKVTKVNFSSGQLILWFNAKIQKDFREAVSPNLCLTSFYLNQAATKKRPGSLI